MNLQQKIRRLLNWEETPKPDPSILPQIYSFFKPFRLPLIMVQLLMMFGALGYVYIEDYTLMDALFQAGYTFTTVGFGALKEGEFSAGGQLFTITLIIFGFGVFSIALGIVVDVVNKGDFNRTLKERQMLYRIARLKKHFVVCYHNDYTVELTKQLRQSHIPFVVVDPRPDLGELAEKHKYPYFLQEEPHTERAMLKSHISSAKGLITLSSSIADNIALIASTRLFEKELRVPQPYYVISSADSDSDVEKLKKLGADMVVSPTKLTAQRIGVMAARPDMENLLEEFLYRSDTPLDMEEVFVPKTSWLVLKKLKETHLRQIANVSVVGMTQQSGKFTAMPKGDMLITSESKLLMIGTQKGIATVKELIKLRQKPKELRFV